MNTQRSFESPTLEQQLAEIPEEERVHNLMNICNIVIPDQEYLDLFTEVDLVKENAKLAEITKERYDKEEELKLLADPIKEDIKTLGKNEKTQQSIIKDGGIKKYGDVYVCFVDGMAHEYNCHGKMFNVRPMNHKEKVQSKSLFNV